MIEVEITNEQVRELLESDKKRTRGWSRWHYDDSEPAPALLGRYALVDIKHLPLSICKTTSHNLMLDEQQKHDPPHGECCPLCLKKLSELTAPVLPMTVPANEPKWRGRKRVR